jgi:hypothetical protein
MDKGIPSMEAIVAANSIQQEVQQHELGTWVQRGSNDAVGSSKIDPR